MNWRITLSFVVLCLGLLAVLAKGFGSNPREVPFMLKGQAAPPFTLRAMDSGMRVSLEQLKGRPAVINFWASWCGPCKEETPLLERTWQRWRDRDVVFVGVNVKDFRGDALEFLREYDVTYPNVYDGKGWTVGRFGVTGFPETYFIDAAGRVVYRVAGPVDESDLATGIDRARAAT